MYRGLTICVVVPAFDEEKKIGATLASMPDWVDRVVVVDDASRDRTAAIVDAHDRPGLERIAHPTNQGVGASIVSGYRRALELGVDAAVVMAGDNQMDPADLPAVLDPLADGAADYVKGNRLVHPDVWRVMPRDRLAGTIALSFLTRLSSGYPGILDAQSGYTAIASAALARLDLRGIAPRYGYCNDLLARANEADLRLAQVPVRPVYNGAHSGIVIHQVIPALSAILLRSGARRVWRKHFRPLLSPNGKKPTDY